MNKPIEARRPQRAPGSALVTGCAGFIGARLSERLVEEGRRVVGVDSFSPFYARELKERNLLSLSSEPAFELRELDLAEASLEGILDGIDAVFHLAGQPGARQSFGPGARECERNNAHATERLLAEALRAKPRVFVHASSSTIYGEAATLPTPEDAPLAPITPYGESKVAAERAVARAGEHGLATVILRYFSGYGPRQRPDMAISRFIERIALGQPVPLYGDGGQVRDFTYVDDLAEATLLAASRGRPGSVFNVGGGEPTSLDEVVRMLGDLLGVPAEIELQPAPPGDARRTRADTSRAQAELGFRASVPLAQGLAAQVDWARGVTSAPALGGRG